MKDECTQNMVIDTGLVQAVTEIANILEGYDGDYGDPFPVKFNGDIAYPDSFEAKAQIDPDPAKSPPTGKVRANWDSVKENSWIITPEIARQMLDEYRYLDSDFDSMEE